ncbi:hypothetical protein Tco_1053321, partial [Tanacetum coccineum]
MVLAVRATLIGWKLLYLGSIKVKNKLPSTFKGYRYQQHRWSCGPANLFRKMIMEIIRNKNVMSLHQTKATFIGLFETGKVNEWVVTEKLEKASKGTSKPLIKHRFRIGE